MKIHILSDLHLEFASLDLLDVGADVVVLAGDIDLHIRGLDWIRLQTDLPVIYVPGNHEYYGSELKDVKQQLLAYATAARAAGQPVYVLDNDAIEIEGVRFLGSTLWTDYKLFGAGQEMAFAMTQAQRYLMDHRMIRCAPQDHFTPSQALDLHSESVAWLAGELAKSFDGKIVVVTHHLPSELSVSDRFKASPLSPAFASKLDHLVEKANLWVHGHTHDSFDYALGNCRVVCNPRGYVRERHDRLEVENGKFMPDLVVEI